MTRAIIADPDLPRRSRTGGARGRASASTRAASAGSTPGMPMWCSVNPAHPRAGARRARPGRRRRRGSSSSAAGWPAWRRPARRRSAVTAVVLFERRPELGGRARLAGLRRGRERWHRYIDWLRDEAEAAGAESALASRRTPQDVLAERPDAVIVATGSVLRPEARLPGPVPVLDVDELLEGGVAAVPDPSSVGARSSTTMAASARADRRGGPGRGGLRRSRSRRPIRSSAT